MKTIDAQNQTALSVRRCVLLALSGMSYRLLRSSITTAILALAVAFLVYVLTYGVMSQRTQASAWEQLAPERFANEWLTRLTLPADAATVRRDLLNANLPAERTQQWRLSLGDQPEALGVLREMAERFKGYADWAERLDPAAAAVLLGGRAPEDSFTSLIVDESTRRTFRDRLTNLGIDGPFAEDSAVWSEITQQYPAYAAAMASVRIAHTQAIAQLAAQSPAGVMERLAAVDPALHGQITEAGFVVPKESLRKLRGFVRQQRDLESVRAALRDPGVGPRVAGRWGSSEFDQVMVKLADADNLPVWEELAGEHFDRRVFEGADGSQSPRLAQDYVHRQRLAAATQGYVVTNHATPFGLPPATLWLVVLSLLVCVVGVTNALLMSVTERFAEIATMKCLGALDASVMRIFVIEALIQGLVGGSAGVLLGLGLALSRGFAEFGGLFNLAFSGGGTVLAAAGSAANHRRPAGGAGRHRPRVDRLPPGAHGSHAGRMR